MNAQRQARFRQRQRERQLKKVTHQGSTGAAQRDPLRKLLNAAKDTQSEPTSNTADTIFCHFCNTPCDVFLRRGFLQRAIRDG